MSGHAEKIGLQLWSLRDDAKRDFVKVLEETARIGYKGVEFAGYWGMGSKDLRKVLDDLGLIAIGSHVSLQQLKDDLSGVIEYSLALGARYIVCPSHPDVTTKEEWEGFAKLLESFGETVASHGLIMGYHNHSSEFCPVGGRYPWDIIFECADPKYLRAEMDLGWAMYAGVDPIVYLKKYAGRCPLVHVKDFDSDNNQTEVGTGKLDLLGVVRVASESGADWMIVETEEYHMTPLESVKVGFDNLKAAAARS